MALLNIIEDSLPSARIGHAAIQITIKVPITNIFERYMYVYGGLNSTGIIGDLWVYNITY